MSITSVTLTLFTWTPLKSTVSYDSTKKKRELQNNYVFALHSLHVNVFSRGPLGGISADKNRGKRIQVRGGIAAHTTSSREESAAWTPGATACVTAARRPRLRRGRRRSLLLPPEPSAWAYRGRGYPVGGRSYQGLDTSVLTTMSRRWLGLFFGGSGPGSSQGVFPFSAAENLRIGAMGVTTSNGARRKKKQEDMKR